jgi:hypothetical protein
MNCQRTRAPRFTPGFELLEDIARTLRVSSENLRECLCPDKAHQVRPFWSWLCSSDFTPAAIAEIRRYVINSVHPDLAHIEAHFDQLLGLKQ